MGNGYCQGVNINDLFFREERQSERTLREEQDAAYQKSLAADRVKEQLRKRPTASTPPETEVVTESEKSQKSHSDKTKDSETRKTLGPEPVEGLRFSFQLSTGAKLTRKFSPSEPCSYLYDFVTHSMIRILPFALLSHHPSFLTQLTPFPYFLQTVNV